MATTSSSKSKPSFVKCQQPANLGANGMHLPTINCSLFSLLQKFSSLSSFPPSKHKPKPKWSSNLTLTITNPVLAATEQCDSMAELKQIQAHMTRTGLISHHFPFSRLLAFCALSDTGDLRHACQLFDHFPEPNTFMLNAMIRGHTLANSPLIALDFFIRMVRENLETDCRTFVFALKSSEQLQHPFIGRGIHCLIYKMGFASDSLVLNGLMHWYVHRGKLVAARMVFDGILEKDVVSWTTMIDGYSQKGFPCESLRLFRLMRSTVVLANEITMVPVISACSQLGIVLMGECVHGFIEKGGVSVSANSMNALVDMYGKCGCLGSARKVFDGITSKDVFSWTSLMNGHAKSGEVELARRIFYEMPETNAVSWSCMIAGYAQANRPKEALDLFREMGAKNVEAINATLVSVLSACSRCGCLDLGRWIYTHYIEGRKMELTVNLANAFIDMYSKCGAIDQAAMLFFEMPGKDIVSWNTMILGYAVHGYGKEALRLFEGFKSVGMEPDDITFVGVLSACSHAGLIAEGRQHFKDMIMLYGKEPKAEHYACLIDLHGRLGLVDDAFELVKSMPMEPDEAGWGALLSACKMYGNVELGKCVGDKLLGLDPGDSGTYALLSDIYATRNRWDDVKMVRRIMRDKGIRKTPGCSSIEVDGKFHEFFSADQSHFLSKHIYTMLSMIYMNLRWRE